MMRKGRGWIIAGLLLMAAALFLTGYNLWEQRRAGSDAAQAASALVQQLPAEAESTPAYLLTPEMEMPETTIDGTAYIGVLRIPSLGLELPVASQWSYPTLKHAPCRYSGSAYLDDLVLCAHNYPSHFGQLGSLRTGDEITFTDVDGNVFTYAVAGLESLSPTAIEDMEGGGWALTLFTCTVGGQSRMALRCDRAAS